MRLARLFLALLIWTLPLQAQDQRQEPLVVPFFPVPPFFEFDEAGERSGFSPELAELIGEELGIEIAFLDVTSSAEFVEALSNGRATFMPGVARLPPLAGTSVFSNTNVDDELRLVVLENRADEFPNGQVAGKRVGIVPPAVGSDLNEVLNRNVTVEFHDVEAAVMGLLIGNVDALLNPNPVTFAIAKQAQADGRIRFVGDPIRAVERVVSLHESRADLLAQVNDVLAGLENDGRLESLRRRYNVTVPAPPPDVLRVGVAHVPPLSIIDEEGNLSGFAVEVTRTLAERANLEIQFVSLTVADWVKGPNASALDAISALVITPERLEEMDFSFPIAERNIAVVLDNDDPLQASDYSDLAGKRVGVIAGSAFAKLVDDIEVFELVGFDSFDAMYKTKLSQDIDAIITAPDVGRREIERLGMADQLRVMVLDNESIDSGIALRPGLGAVRERLNAVIPGFILSEEYSDLRRFYFGEPVFWTPTRIYGGLGAVGVLFLGLLGSLVWQRQLEYKRQQAELVREQAHSAELAALVVDLERSNRDLDEFAYIASHDLKEPLRGIGINANFLSREDLTGEVRKRVERMGVLSARMEQLISDLLFFSRLGRGDKTREIVQPAEVIEAIRNELDEWLVEQGGEIIEVAAIPALRAESIKVKTVLQNLIINGIKFNTQDRKTVEVGFVETANVRGEVLNNAIVVKDNGIGIEEKHHEKAFRIFSRLNPKEDFDSSAGIGTGSGLAFVRRIVEEHGGVIDFTSTPGDEAIDYLRMRGKYEGTDHAMPGVILLDLNLPGTDGRDVLAVLKNDPGTKRLPVVVMTSSKDQHDIDRCYDAGANSYVVKPVDLEGFLAAIARLRDYWFKIVVLPRPE